MTDAWTLSAKDPRWPDATPPHFGEHYELVVDISFPARGPRPERVRRGPASPRVCSLCGKDKSTTSFRDRTHLLAQCTGNHHLFTNEGCDHCNKQYGREAENELGKMLLSPRVFGLIRGKEGYPRIKGIGSLSFIRPNADGTAIEVAISERDKSIAVNVVDQTIDITVPEQSFRPYEAFRSLMKSAQFRTVHFRRAFNIGQL